MKIKAYSYVFLTLTNGIKIFLGDEVDSTSYELWYAPDADDWYDEDCDDGGIIEDALFDMCGNCELTQKAMDFILLGTGVTFDESLIKSYAVDDEAEQLRKAIDEEPFTCDNAFDYIVAQIQSELDYDKKPYTPEYCEGEQIFRLHAEDGEVTVRVQISARNAPVKTSSDTTVSAK